MADDDFDARQAQATAHVGFALVNALLNELEKQSPGLRKRVWVEAQRSLEEYDVLDANNADWLRQKVADL